MKISQLITVTLMLFTSLTSLDAQVRGTTELAFSWGKYSTNEIVDVLYRDIVIFASRGDIEYDDYRRTGAVRASLKVAPYDRLTIGASVVYEQSNSDAIYQNKVIGQQNLYFLTGAIELDYRYVTVDSYQMYFSLAAGGTMLYDVFTDNETNPDFNSHNELNSPYPNFHVNVLGMRFGDNVGVFAELGFGYKGIVNVGLSFQPKPL